MLRGLFARGAARSRPDPEPLKQLVRSALSAGLTAKIELTISEIECLDPSCPGTETVILIMAPRRPTKAAKIGKPMAEVTEQDVLCALVAAGFEVS